MRYLEPEIESLYFAVVVSLILCKLPDPVPSGIFGDLITVCILRVIFSDHGE